MQIISIRKEFTVILICMLIILIITPIVNCGANIKDEEVSMQDTLEKNCLCQQNIDNDRTLDQFNGLEKVDEQGHSLMRNFDNNWEQQKMGVSSGTSIICGYVTDEETGLPVENAKIDIQGTGYSAYTNSTGFYSKITPPTYSVRLHAHGEGYLSKYQCCYVLYENKTKWVNLSLRPRPPETSIVYGYVIDKETGDPIEDANVKLQWRDEDWHHYQNSTYTDSLGFYSMNVGAPGSMQLCAYVDAYIVGCWDRGNWKDIDKNETAWANISVYPLPPENSVIYGYLTDNLTGTSLEGAEVELRWSDGGEHSYSNFTYTDSLGFYLMNAPAGRVRIYGYADGYWDERSSLYIIGEYETVCVNLSLDPLPPENSVVCGYITDVNTDELIELALIGLFWEDTWWPPWNRTYTGTSGFYKMNLPAGEFHLTVEAHGYLYEKTDRYNITENETIWLNISMYPRPPKNSIVCGYIKNEDTGEPIYDVFVDFQWRDLYGHNIWDFDYTNTSGYYWFDTAAGEIRLEVYHYHYGDESTDWLIVGENETLWINFSLKLENTPPYAPWITGPKRGKPGQEYNYTFYTEDAHYDYVYYYIEWDDGNYSGWIGPYYSGEELVISYTFLEKGTYYIRAKAKDVYGAESDWSYLKVKMPKNHNLLWWLKNLLDRFPLLQWLLGWFIW